MRQICGQIALFLSVLVAAFFATNVAAPGLSIHSKQTSYNTSTQPGHDSVAQQRLPQPEKIKIRVRYMGSEFRFCGGVEFEECAVAIPTARKIIGNFTSISCQRSESCFRLRGPPVCG
jgi:hypothetical protein